MTDWGEFQQFVVTQLQEIRVELAEIRAKDRFITSLWGFVAGSIPAILAVLWRLLGD